MPLRKRKAPVAPAPETSPESVLSLTDLKTRSMQDLMDLADQYQVENASSLRKQELIFALLQACASQNGAIQSDGVLEILPDGYGFLRSPLCSYMPGPDDVYVSPSQIRRYHLRKGDSVTGQIRPPKEGERYFALVKVNEIGFEPPENARHLVLFDNLTPIYPDQQMCMETDGKNMASRVIDLMAPIGRGQRGLIVAPPRTGKTVLLQTIANSINANYPYVLTDGATIYYAADGENSIGGYDIFVTRYNTNTNTYLTPENVGMPFNSPYNDYMFAIDEFNNLGWFASDRYQPEGKVCIYVFIPNSSKRVYNYEAMDKKKVVRLAQIHSLKDTWVDQNTVSDAKRRLQAAISEKPQAERSYDFEFVIDDHTTYYQWSDFKSPQAKSLFSKYRQLEKSFRQQQNKLEEQRSLYSRAKESDKAKLAPAILDLEKQIQRLSGELEKAAIEVRNTEKQSFK